MSETNCTPTQPTVNLAAIQEWLCECSKAAPDHSSQIKFAQAAQAVQRARELLLILTPGDHKLISEVWEIVGRPELSPDARKEAAARRLYEGGGIEVIKQPENKWLAGLNWLFRR